MFRRPKAPRSIALKHIVIGEDTEGRFEGIRNFFPKFWLGGGQKS